MSRARIAIAALVAIAAVLAVGVIAYSVSRSGGSSALSLGPARYVDETGSAGLDHTYVATDLLYFTGGGVAVFDCDGDRMPDVYVAGGEAPATLFHNAGQPGGPLRFTAMHDPATDLEGVNGAYPIDIDGDGNVDLAVLRTGENVLLRGLGGCRFERANEDWSFPGGNGLTAAFSATWEAPTGLPTLAVGDYLAVDANGQTVYDCADDELIRPDPTGTRYGPVIALHPSWCTLSLLFSDWDRSGRRDLRVSNDRQYYDQSKGMEQLWRIAPGEAPRLYTETDGWKLVRIYGMGIASYDLTGDGYPEVYLTSEADNRLMSLTDGPQQPTYGDIGLARGVVASEPFTGGDPGASTAWHPEFQDVNNDGYIDLFVSKGNVNEVEGFAKKDPSNLFLGTPDGTFVESADTSGILSFAKGRGAALADFNLDGLLDLIEVNLNDPVLLWQNVGTGTADEARSMGHWLGLELQQPGPNRDAIGAWIEVKAGDLTQQRELTIGGGHSGGQLGPVHVGLGSAESADVRVTWPDGEEGPWQHLAADGYYTIERGASQAQPWTLPGGG